MRAKRGIMIAVLAMASALALAEERHRPKCRRVSADLVEDEATVGCHPPARRCFFGEVAGRGLRATTYFNGDSSAAGPSTSPGFISYGGVFEYTTERGVLNMRETGVVNTTTGNPESGAVTAYQKVVGGSGEFEGATGYLFVSGFQKDGHVETEVIGEICRP
jgi:hypothetical protein